VDAVDANILIYAAKRDPRGHGVAELLATGASSQTWLGSVLLVPEVLSSPLRKGFDDELHDLQLLLSRVELKAVDHETADLSATLGAKYGLRAADSIHLATAVLWGADRFHTNNSKDFGQYIDEIEIVLPERG
jgi:predicted nucleic acid-binding protein